MSCSDCTCRAKFTLNLAPNQPQDSHCSHSGKSWQRTLKNTALVQTFHYIFQHHLKSRDSPGDPVAKTPRCSQCRGGPGSIPGQGTGSHMPELRAHVPQLKILHATTKTQCSQINKNFFLRKSKKKLKSTIFFQEDKK